MCPKVSCVFADFWRSPVYSDHMHFRPVVWVGAEPSRPRTAQLLVSDLGELYRNLPYIAIYSP